MNKARESKDGSIKISYVFIRDNVADYVCIRVDLFWHFSHLRFHAIFP